MSLLKKAHAQCLNIGRHARPRPAPSSLTPSLQQTRRASAFKPDRFTRYAEEIPANAPYNAAPRNPLNYLEYEKRLSRRDRVLLRRIIAGTAVMIVLVSAQWVLIHNYGGEPKEKKDTEAPKPLVDKKSFKLDGPQGWTQGGDGIKVVQKPGNPDVKIDEAGNELVDTGTSTIPHFPRSVLLRSHSSKSEPSAVHTSSVPEEGAQERQEEYTLLGLGVRTVSFLSIQVYVLGLYVRTTDLDKLQAAFVRHVNPLGSSLIPGEKESLKKSLLNSEENLQIWDKVLQEVLVRSAVRIVPTRGTGFTHLRDGWVTGITNRTNAARQRGEAAEFDDATFGTSIQEFKNTMGSKRNAPKGSVIYLMRDEKGVLSLLFDRTVSSGGVGEKKLENLEFLGTIPDERVSRLIWLGYLGGKDVSSKKAQESISNGVMELVERPVGTVGVQVT